MIKINKIGCKNKENVFAIGNLNDFVEEFIEQFFYLV